MACARAPPGPQIPSTSPETAPPSSGRPPSRPIASRPVHGKMDTRTATQLRAPAPGPASQPCPGSLCGSGRAGQPRDPPPAARAKLPSLPPPPGLRAAFSAPWLLGSPRLRSLWAPRSTRPPSGFRLYSASCTSAIWVGCRECPWPRGSGRFIRRWWTRRSFSFWGVTIKNTA